MQKPSTHLSNKGCQKCAGRNKSINELIIEFVNIHGSKYDYSLINHTKSKIKVDIICKLHSIFSQTPNNHLQGKGCPVCKESKGEKIIRNILTKNNINYIQQYKFKDCFNIKPLMFDFYLPDYNVCIEYDGEQHFKPMRFFKPDVSNFELKNIQKRDKIKNNYCKKNNIKLIRIRFDENIDKYLNKSGII